MAKKLYIGGISYSTTDNSLKEVFSKAGNVISVAIIMDRVTGRSKGFGFIEMASDTEAQAAIQMFNGLDFEGRKLSVSEARSKEEKPRNNRNY